LFCFVFFPDFQLSGNVAVPTRVLSLPTQNYNAVHSGEKNQQLKNRIALKMYLSPSNNSKSCHLTLPKKICKGNPPPHHKFIFFWGV